MGAIAGSALVFASLPWFLSIPLVVAVFGILGLDGIHPPLVTSGGGERRWGPWAVWSLGLAACPIAMAVLDTVYEHGGPPVYDRWVARVLESQRDHARRLLNDRHYNHWVARLQAIQSGRARSISRRSGLRSLGRPRAGKALPGPPGNHGHRLGRSRCLDGGLIPLVGLGRHPGGRRTGPPLVRFVPRGDVRSALLTELGSDACFSGNAANSVLTSTTGAYL